MTKGKTNLSRVIFSKSFAIIIIMMMTLVNFSTLTKIDLKNEDITISYDILPNDSSDNSEISRETRAGSSSADIMIFAPHPDDETLGAAGAIYDAVESGESVKVVVMTNGDGYEDATEAYYAYQKYGDEYWYTTGLVSHVSNYPQGIVLSPGVYNVGGGGAVYLFENIPKTSLITISVKHYESGWGLHDLGIWAKNCNTLDYDLIEETQVDGEQLWRTTIDGNKYINALGKVEILLGADAWDESDIAWVKIDRDLDPSVAGTESYYIDFGKIRQEETREAMKSLGLQSTDVIFLGYPDGGFNDIWEENYNYIVGGNDVYKSLTTDSYSSPYPDTYSHELYQKDSVLKDLRQLLTDYSPTEIYVTHSLDTHGDHSATNYFVNEAIRQIGKVIDVFNYLIHYNKSPYGGCNNQWPLPDWEFLQKPVDSFRDPDIDIIFDDYYVNYVDKSDLETYSNFKEFKLNIINKYYGQLYYECDITYLESFAKKNELYWSRALSYDPTIDGFSFPNYVTSSESDLIKNEAALLALKNSFQNGLVDGVIRKMVVSYVVSNLIKGGLCLGMAATSVYYYYHPNDIPGGKQDSSVLLRNEVIDEIIDRHVWYNLHPKTVRVGISGFLGLLDDNEQYDIIKAHLDRGDLAIIMLYNPYSLENHAVIVYDYQDQSGGTIFYLYDPNNPASVRELFVDNNYKINYKGYSQIAYLGNDIPGGDVSDTIWDNIWQRAFHAVLFSPASLHAYDSLPYHTGPNSMGGIDMNILGSYYIPQDPTVDESIIILHALDSYTFIVEGYGYGTFSLSVEVFTSISYTRVLYQNIPVTPTTIASVYISQFAPNYTMYIDGIERYPDEITELEIIEIMLPVANAGSDQIVNEGDTVYLDASKSHIPEGEIIEYKWTFNDITLYGEKPTYIWYDNTVICITLEITSRTLVPVLNEDGSISYKYEYQTATDTVTITVINVDPTATIDRAYMYVDFTLRGAGEKWHNIYWDLYETDWDQDGGMLGLSTLKAHLEIERYPGEPQTDTAYDVYIDAEKIYYFVATYNPYEDDNPINGKLWGSNPIWIDLTFEDNSTERIHHNFNVQQSIVRDSEHWVHVLPWKIDLSPWFVNHTWTFEGSTNDPGTDDELFHWEWDDLTSDDTFYTYRMNGEYDPYPSSYDKDEGSYPVAITDIEYHTYSYEDNFFPTLIVIDDDNGIAIDTLDVDAIHTQHIYPVK